MKKEFQLSDRREFLADSLRTVALLGALGSGPGQAAQSSGQAATLADSLLRYGKTDPKFLAYDQGARWKSPAADPKRIVIRGDRK